MITASIISLFIGLVVLFVMAGYLISNDKVRVIVLGVISICFGVAVCLTPVFMLTCVEHTEEYVIKESYELVSANDSYSLNGTMYGNIFHIHATLEENSMYRYYYKMKDGGIKQGNIPADQTTIYLVSDQVPHIEEVWVQYYSIYKNKKEFDNEEFYGYRLYVPNGSITDIFEFDGK